MPAASSYDKIAAMYVAYFNRAPDVDGLGWWNVQFGQGQSETDISRGFANHPQFQVEYGGLGSRQFVEKLYVNMLGNAGDAGGISFWVDRLDGAEQLSRSDMVAEFVRGVLEIDLEAIRGQLSEADYTAAKVRQDKLWNKVEAAKYFATTLDALTDLKDSNVTSNTLTQDMAYQASIDILRGVTEDPASLVEARSLVDTIRDSSDYSGLLENYANIIKASPVQTAYTGTSGNDVFQATYSAIKADNSVSMGADSTFNGGDGFDVLSLTIDSVPLGASSSNYPNPNLIDVEQVRINVTPTMQTNNTNVRIGIGQADVLVTGTTAEGSDLTLVSQSKSTPNVTLLHTNADIELRDGNYSWGTLSSARVTLDGYNAETLSFGGSIGTVNLYAYNNASSITNSLGSISTLNINGDADLNLGVSYSSRVDASTHTGDLTLWQSSSWSDGQNVTLGSGNDWLQVAALHEDRLIFGGAGRDMLVMDIGQFTAIKTQGVSAFEEVELNGNAVSGVLDAQLINGVDTLWFDTYTFSSTSVQLTNVGDGQVLGLKGASHVIVSKTVDTASDTLNLALLGVDSGSTYDRYTGGLRADAYETINLESRGEAANFLKKLSSTGLSQLNVTGNADLAIETIPGNLTVNASGFASNLTVTASIAGALSFTGGTGDDRVVMGSTLDATDVLAGGGGFDTLSVSDMRTLRAANVEKVTGFEALELTSANTTADVGLMNGLQQVVLNGSSNDDFVLQNFGAGTELVLKNLDSVTVTGKADTASDTLKIVSYEEYGFYLNTLGYEKLELNVQGFDTANAASVYLENLSEETAFVVTGGTGDSLFNILDAYYGSAENLSVLDASSFSGRIGLRLDDSDFNPGLTVTGTKRDDTIYVEAGRYTVDAGDGNDKLVVSSVSSYASTVSQHVLTGGAGNDLFVLNNTGNDNIRAQITDLDLGTSLTSADRIDIAGSYADGASLTDAQIDVYTGGSTSALADARVLVLNDGRYADSTDVLSNVRTLGIEKGSLTVFWADQGGTVHMSAVPSPASSYGDIYELAALTNLTIQGVAQNLDYTDFV